MSRNMRTPAANVRGLGAAREGTTHYIRQRVSAIALLVLLPIMLISGLLAAKDGYEGISAWIGHPVFGLLLLLTLGAAFYHMRLGMQVVIEDYIAKISTRQFLLVLNTFVTIGVFAATALSVLKIWLATG